MRTHKRAAVVTLQIVVTDEGQGSIVGRVTHAVHEALQRRVAANFPSGPGLATGLETFIEGQVEHLKSGGAATITSWREHNIEEAADASATRH